MHVRCPHCENPIEVLDDQPLSDILCDSCDSSFSLVDGETQSVTQVVPETKTLGHFEVLQHLGMGAFGTVWRARDTELDRSVAIKMPRSGQIGPQNMEAFLREARAAAQLNHPNIVGVHEVGREGDSVYIVSDFVEGVTLGDYLTAKRFTPQEATELCVTIAGALHHAHEAGITHRDLKPSNIMLDDEGEPHIMDFGLAKREAGEITMTMEGKVLGTPAYMSPEQAKGEAHQADRRSDVYSLGTILFELLTGEVPFRGNTRMLLHQVMNDDPPSLRKLNGNVPRDLETIALKCLEKEPGKRYRTANELGEDLGRFLSGKPVVARPLGRLAKAWRYARRHPARAALFTVSLVALVALAVASVSVGYQDRLVSMNQALESANRGLQTGNANLSESLGREAEAKRQLARAQEELQQSYYARRVSLALSEWKDGDVGRAETLLAECAPERRGWEWHYVYRLCHSDLLTLTGHMAGVYSVAFSPDGRRIVSGSGDKTLKIWNAATGQETLTLKGHAGPVVSVAFSLDGSRIVSTSEDKTVRIWDATTGQEAARFAGHRYPVNVAFGPGGTRIVSAGDYNEVKVRNAITGRDIRTFTLSGDSAQVGCVAFSPDGSRIASGGVIDDTVRIMDVTTGQETLTLTGHTDGVYGVAFSPDGSRIVSGSADKTLKMWDVETGQDRLTLNGHTRPVASVAFSPDGSRIVSGSADRTVRIWDVATGQETLALKGHSDLVPSVAFSPDGTRIASAGPRDKTVKVWDADTAQGPLTIKGSRVGSGGGFSPDGSRIVGSRDKTVTVWDAETGQETLALKGHTDWVQSVAFAPDGRRIVSGSADKTVRLWDAETGQETLALKGHTDWVGSVAFSPDGSKIASGSEDTTVKMWDVGTGQEILTLEGHASPVRGVGFSPGGGRIVSGSHDGTVKVWDAESGQETLTVQEHTESLPVHAVFCPDGTRVVSGSWDGTVKVWDAVTGQEVITLKGHSAGVLSVEFSPDGSRILSGGFDRALKVWDTRPMSERRRAVAPVDDAQ